MFLFEPEEIEKATRTIQKFKTQKTEDEIFYNLCFCILVPQSRFKNILNIVENLKQLQFKTQWVDLENVIKDSRFKFRKGQFLLDMKKNFDSFYISLKNILESNAESREKRKFIVDNVKGIGLKTASQFLRNMGVDDLAIIDTHILKHMGLTKKFNYIEVEDKIRDAAKTLEISVAVLDAIIWSKNSKVQEENFIY